jgi:hypothetical protein
LMSKDANHRRGGCCLIEGDVQSVHDALRPSPFQDRPGFRKFFTERSMCGVDRLKCEIDHRILRDDCRTCVATVLILQA